MSILKIPGLSKFRSQEFKEFLVGNEKIVISFTSDRVTKENENEVIKLRAVGQT